MEKLSLLFMVVILLFSCNNEIQDKTESQELVKGDTSRIEKVQEELDPIPEDESLPSLDQVMGKFNPVSDTNFVKIESRYTDKAAIYLQKEVYLKFLEMHEHAARDSVPLFILSATRPFAYQRNIWERKWAKLIGFVLLDPWFMATGFNLKNVMIKT